MATLEQMRYAVGGELGLAYSTAGDERDLIDRRINEGVTDFMLRTGSKVIPATMTLAAGSKDYTLDDDVLLIKFAYLDGTSSDSLLTQVSPEDLIEMHIRGGDNANAPMYYALNGSNLFEVYPTPAEETDVVVYYVPRPATLTSEADSPSEIPAEFHQGPELYALWRLASFDDDQSSGQGERYREEYDRWVLRARRYVNGKGGVKLPRARVGRRRLVPHDRSADWR